MKKNRAFLKWAGGKYPLLDDIKRHLPKGECLVEPFVGAGSVFLNTDFSRYILADINSDLISLYNIVKMRTDEYVQAARELFVPETNCAEVYYQFREEFNKSQDPFRRAVLLLYLNRYGYNGLCRYNLRGEFNVPFGRYKKPYFPEAELYHFAEKAQNAFFYCESYADSMARADDASVVYCDPPYAPLSATANFTAYHTNSFTLEQQAHLAEIAEGLVDQLGQLAAVVRCQDDIHVKYGSSACLSSASSYYLDSDLRCSSINSPMPFSASCSKRSISARENAAPSAVPCTSTK